jgi:hypothetical protein
MSGCNDPALMYLKAFGYNVVRLPRTTIQPLDIIGTDGDTSEWLGPISIVWTSERPAPTPREGASGSIQGKQTSSFKISVGLEILGGLLDQFGINIGGLKAGYSKAKQLQFKFDAPQIVTVEPLAAGSYLSAGELESDNPFVKRYFSPPRGSFLITEVLRSKSITVIALDKNDQDAAVDLPKIQAAVGLKLEVQRMATKEGEVIYSGKEELTFGFKAFEIGRAKGKWTIQGVDPGALSLGVREFRALPEPTAAILGEDGWVTLIDRSNSRGQKRKRASRAITPRRR